MGLEAALFHETKSPVRRTKFQLLPYNASSKSACGRPLSKQIPHPINRDGIEGPDPWLAHPKKQFLDYVRGLERAVIVVFAHPIDVVSLDEEILAEMLLGFSG